MDADNLDKEIEFELDFLKSRTIKERFQMMFQKTKEMMDLLPAWRQTGRKMDTEGLLKLLKEHKVKFVIIGATAFPVHGYSRATFR